MASWVVFFSRKISPARRIYYQIETEEIQYSTCGAQ